MQKKSKLLDRWIFLTLLIPIYGTCFPPQTYFYVGNIHDQTFEAGWQMPVILLTLAASIITMALYHIKQGRRVGHDPVVYLFILTVFASIPMSGEIGYSFNRALRLLPLVAFGVLYAQIIPWRKMVSMMTVAFLVSACVSVFISTFFPALGNSHYEGVYETAWRGAISHKNSAGAIYAIGTIVCVHALLSGYCNRTMSAFAVATCFLMVVKSQSATSLSATMLTLPIYCALRLMQRTRPEIRMLAIITLIGLIASAALILSAFPALGTSLVGRDSTFTGRTEIWRAVWWAIQQAPIRGHGYGFWGVDSPTFERITILSGFLPGHSHNDWLDLWLQIGIFGVIAIAGDILYVMGRSLVLLIRTNSPEPALLFAIMVFTVIRSFVEIQFTDPGPTNLFWLAWCSVGVRMLAHANRRTVSPSVAPPMPAQSAGLAVA